MINVDISPKRLKTRNRIIDVSKDLFEEYGITNTQIKQIAEKSEITRMTVYDHFPTKIDIINAILYDYFVELYSFDIDYSDCNNGFEKNRKLFHTIFQRYFDKDYIMRFLISYYQEFPNKTEYESIIFEELEKVINTKGFKILIEEGIKDGSITSTTPYEVSNIILQHIIGIGMRYSLRSDAFFGNENRVQTDILHKSLDMLLNLYKEK